jgi:hypothetical protein
MTGFIVPAHRVIVGNSHKAECERQSIVRRFPSRIMSSVFDNFISGNGHVKSKETT